ncbi:MAG TPA: major capsid protein [Virgibacillus sp.]|nr:major capsid protein [Virgibacillus sp.]HLR69429.1 major capsid protein [Virgibacillus sp.]
MPLHLDEFQRDQLQGYVENVPAQRAYLLSSFMPTSQSYDINFAYNVINGKYANSASITGWNASAPLRDKKEIEKAFAEVAKVQHGVRLDEKELLAFNRPRSDQERAQVVEYVYSTTDDLSQGVDDIEEYMRAQAIYTGGLKYEDEENDIYIDVEFGVPEENKIDVSTDWSDADSTPLEDIQAAVKQYQKNNQRRKPAVMHMTSTTESLLLQNEQIRIQAYGNNNGGRLLTENDVQNVLTTLGLPPYQVNDDVIVVNDEEVQLLEDGKVVLLGADLGETVIGPTIENNYNPGKFVTPLIENNPPSQTVIVGEAVFPALKRPQSIVIVNVGDATP